MYVCVYVCMSASALPSLKYWAARNRYINPENIVNVTLSIVNMFNIVTKASCPQDVTIWKRAKHLIYAINWKTFLKYLLSLLGTITLNTLNKLILFGFFQMICWGAKLYDHGAVKYNEVQTTVLFTQTKNEEDDYIVVHSIPSHCKGIFICVSCILQFLHSPVWQSIMSSLYMS